MEKEIRYELFMYQLIIIILVGIFISLGIGYWVGKEAGYSKAISAVEIEKPPYCNADRGDHKIVVRCNELKNITLDSLCTWVPEEFKEKIKILIVT